jgi:hypothetical protein
MLSNGTITSRLLGRAKLGGTVKFAAQKFQLADVAVGPIPLKKLSVARDDIR